MLSEKSERYYTIEKAIRYIESSHNSQPSLAEISAASNMSKFHFQRIFKDWVGISPSDFLRYITISHAKEILKEKAGLLETSIELGLSSPSRLNDLFIKIEASTPGEYKKEGEGLKISYGFASSPFGNILLAETSRGLSDLIFCENDEFSLAEEELQKKWPRAHLFRNDDRALTLAEKIFPEPGSSIKEQQPETLKLYLRGTAFQIKVWEALLTIPPGRLISYADLARIINNPKASRAVGNALAKNPLAYIIPCHRVIRESGIINNYRWGSARKKIIIGWEQASKRQEKSESGKWKVESGKGQKSGETIRL